MGVGSCTPCQEQEREKKEASDLPMEKSEAVDGFES